MFNTKPANQAQAAEKGSLPYLQARNRSARINLLLILFLTLVNIAMLFADGESYYLFSALLPYWLVGFGYYQEVTAWQAARFWSCTWSAFCFGTSIRRFLWRRL